MFMKKTVLSAIFAIAMAFTAVLSTSCQNEESQKELLLKQLEIENMETPLDQEINFNIYDPGLKNVTNFRSRYSSEPEGAIGEHVFITFVLSETGEIWQLSFISSDVASCDVGYDIRAQKAKLVNTTSSWAPSSEDRFLVDITGDIALKEKTDDRLVLRFNRVLVPSIYGNKTDEFIFNGDIAFDLTK